MKIITSILRQNLRNTINETRIELDIVYLLIEREKEREIERVREREK